MTASSEIDAPATDDARRINLMVAAVIAELDREWHEETTWIWQHLDDLRRTE